MVHENPHDRFYLLTKQPQNLIKFSPFPDNAWVGVSTTGNDCNSGLEDIFAPIKAKIKFVSIEPLQDYTPMDFRWIDWVLVGCETKNGRPVREHLPQLSWIKDIIKDCDELGIPVFLKNNLIPRMLSPYDENGGTQYADIFFKKNVAGIYELRQEIPKVKSEVK
jgi:protein gp37